MAARCPRCALHLDLCFCAEVEPLAVETRVVVVQHGKEHSRTSNSGRLVPVALRGGELRLRGAPGVPFAADDLHDPRRRTVLLYPLPGTPILAPDGRPVTLLVPDGNWAQARKLVQREPALLAAERAALPPGPPSTYRLRTHPDPSRVSTFEAVARALGVLEGPAVQAQLERVFAVFVERTLYRRGDLRAADVTGGVPRRPTRPAEH